MSKAQIDELKFDDKNFNKHTEFGMSLLEKSLRENGAERSIRKRYWKFKTGSEE